MNSDTLSMLEAGELWTYAHSAAGIAAGVAVGIGIITGAAKVIALGRSYESTGELMTVRLYKVAFTGGSAPSLAYNRNREFQAAAQPVSILAGVTFTPNTPEIAVVIRAPTTANNATLQVSEGDALELLANTSYVLELVNSDAGVQTLTAQLTLRRRQPSEVLR